MERLKVCLMAGSMPNFSEEGKKIYGRCAAGLQETAKRLGFDLAVFADFIFTQEEAVRARKQAEGQGADLVLFFHPTYLSGDIACEILKTRSAIGLWAVEEGVQEGPLPLASFVCLNQNASIAGHYFKDAPKKFKWFFGGPESRYFKKPFEITVRSLSALKGLRESKVAQIGKIAEGFRNMFYDERALYENLKVDVVRGIEIEDIIGLSEGVPKSAVESTVAHIRKNACIKVEEENLYESARFYLALKDLCETQGFKAVAFSCFPKIFSHLKVTGCLIESLMDSIRIPAACEGDMLSAISMLVLSILSQRPPSVMDMPSFDDRDNSVLLWHCGAAPFEMANAKKTTLRRHYRSEFAKDGEFCRMGPITDIIYPVGPVSVFRFLKEGAHYYYFTGRFFDEEKKSFYGSRGWVNDLRLYQEKIDALDLVNTILYGHVPHHYPMVLEDVGELLEEFAYWMGLQKIPKKAFQDYRSLD